MSDPRPPLCARRFVAATLLLSIAACPLGCSTLFYGTHQTVNLELAPSDAEVVFYRWDGSEVVRREDPAKASISVRRPPGNEPYMVRISKTGYCPAYLVPEIDATPVAAAEGISGLLLFIPGLIALLIDDRGGGGNDLRPDPIQLSLEEEDACNEP